METLLDKAKKVKIKTKINKELSFNFDEELELSLAWINGDITSSQYYVAKYGEYKKPSVSGSVLYRVATILREAATKGKIKITVKK